MKLVIAQAVGKPIRCPQCGRPASVTPARTRVGPSAEVIISAFVWYEVKCPRDGRKLYDHTTVVDVFEKDEASHG